MHVLESCTCTDPSRDAPGTAYLGQGSLADNSILGAYPKKGIVVVGGGVILQQLHEKAESSSPGHHTVDPRFEGNVATS